jgi:uncharacterized repeat protein (TIGR02543 family)
MIKRISFVLIALFFGLFLENCSDSSSNDPELPLSSSLVDALSSSSLQDGTVEPALRAEPVAAVPTYSEPDILYSWTDENKNYYIINVGYIKNSLLMENGFHYSGVGYMGISTTATTENSIAENRTNTVSNSVVVKTGQQTIIGLKEAITAGVTTGVETGGQTGGITSLFVKGSVKASVETTIEGSIETSFQISNSFETSTGRTTETSESFETTLKQSWSNSTSLAANSGDPAGYYRYAWYVVSDVYFIISTSLDNQELLSWEVVSIPREKYELHQEYSQKIFDNSPIDGTEIVFAEGFYKTLPKPPTKTQHTLTVNATEGGSVSIDPNKITYETWTRVTVTATPNAGYVFNGWTGAPSGVNTSNASITFAINSNLTLTASFRKAEKKEEEISFTIPGIHTFTFDKSFPATIEVYTLGGGGGGQGGHTENWTPFPPVKLCGNGIGGGGGGGGAAYMKLSVEELASFEIKVGGGGSGGNPYTNGSRYVWDPGYSGTDGNPTSVTWAAKSITLTANGGVRGGHNRTGAGSGNSGGGSGGGAGARPTSSLVTDWFSAYGGSGKNGNDGDCNSGGDGGSSASIPNIGSGAPFSGSLRGNGGKGGCGNSNGENGGNGEVKIVVSYYE